MKKIVYLLRHYPLTLLCLALIWYLSLFIVMPETPIDNVPFVDKWTHLVMYGGTCTMMWWEYSRFHTRLAIWKLFLLAWLAPILMSGCLELLQEYCTETRSGEWLDLAANSLGVTLGALLGMLIWKLKHSR